MFCQLLAAIAGAVGLSGELDANVALCRCEPKPQAAQVAPAENPRQADLVALKELLLGCNPTPAHHCGG